MIPKALFIVINLVCIAVSVYILVGGFYATIAARLIQQPAVADLHKDRESESDAPQMPLSAYAAVLERNLFNTRSATETLPEQVDVESLQETKLNLKLWGTVSGSIEGAYAVIEDVAAREQNLYRSGDTIQTATVKEIFREKVVLTVNGNDEVLQMQELETGMAASRPSGLPVQTAAASPAAGVGTQRVSLRRSYIEESMTDMASLMTQVQIRPHVEDGVPSGLALSSIQPNSIFRRMGLRNGDVITGVDGTEIASVDDALRLVDNLKSASSLSVQIKRRGQDRTIEYSIR